MFREIKGAQSDFCFCAVMWLLLSKKVAYSALLEVPFVIRI